MEKQNTEIRFHYSPNKEKRRIGIYGRDHKFVTCKKKHDHRYKILKKAVEMRTQHSGWTHKIRERERAR